MPQGDLGNNRFEQQQQQQLQQQQDRFEQPQMLSIEGRPGGFVPTGQAPPAQMENYRGGESQRLPFFEGVLYHDIDTVHSSWMVTCLIIKYTYISRLIKICDDQYYMLGIKS